MTGQQRDPRRTNTAPDAVNDIAWERDSNVAQLQSEPANFAIERW